MSVPTTASVATATAVGDVPPIPASTRRSCSPTTRNTIPSSSHEIAVRTAPVTTRAAGSMIVVARWPR